MSGKKTSRNSQEDADRSRIDHEGLRWALTKIRAWRARVGNRTEIDDQLLGTEMVRLAESGVPESLVGFVILGCEWMFRIRTFEPRDADTVLAHIESRLRPVLHEHAWFVREALAPSVRKLLKTERVLALDWEDMPREVFVPTGPQPVDSLDPYGAGYITRLGTRPEPSIRARRGPPPKPAPWIAGVIAERLRDDQKEAGIQLTSEEQDPVFELVSALCGRTIDKHEYAVRRQSLRIPELDNLVERFKESLELFVSLDTQPALRDHPDWFRVVRTRLEKFGLRDTFPYDQQTVTRLIEAYGTSRAAH
jgi:hypothetical protein